VAILSADELAEKGLASGRDLGEEVSDGALLAAACTGPQARLCFVFFPAILGLWGARIVNTIEYRIS